MNFGFRMLWLEWIHITDSVKPFRWCDDTEIINGLLKQDEINNGWINFRD